MDPESSIARMGEVEISYCSLVLRTLDNIHFTHNDVQEDATGEGYQLPVWTDEMRVTYALFR